MSTQPEPHVFEPAGSSGWCRRRDCGWSADSYVHASEAERKAFDEQRSTGVPEDILTVMRAGQTIAAVRMYRNRFGTDITTATSVINNARLTIPPSSLQPIDEIFAAEQHIRRHHGIDHPRYEFWHEIAGWMNDMATRGMHGTIGMTSNPRWTDFNGCLRAARSYMEAADRGVTEPFESIHRFFGLSYANYLVIPRALLQSMPDKWQAEVVMLLDELSAAFEHVPQAMNYMVQARSGDGKFIRDPVQHYNRGRTRIEPRGHDNGPGD
jgi:hypothetical protein